MKKRSIKKEINPDEIFLDSKNLPSFDTQQFEGKIEKPISKAAIFFVGIVIFAIQGVYITRAWSLQVDRGDYFLNRSEKNTLRFSPIFPERGIIYDRNGNELAWNTPDGRKYNEAAGMSHTVGYVGYPTKDEISDLGFNPKEYVGRDGIEKVFNDKLRGTPGSKIVEVDATGKVISENVRDKGEQGDALYLSVDSRVNGKLSELLKNYLAAMKFPAGAAVVMDVKTGEILAMSSHPDFSQDIMSGGSDAVAIKSFLNSTKSPLLNRVVSGLYAPGSTIKPVIAMGVLQEKVISPDKKILSTGSISIPNPYFPDKFSVFKDWKAHGWVNLRQAIAVSSDVYFYAVGGGFEDQRGIGITNIDKYAGMFGLGTTTKIEVEGEGVGTIPSPDWKLKNFNGQSWLLGDTYNTVIGQYGFLVTPLQMARAIAAIANDGYVVRPTLLMVKEGESKDLNGEDRLPLDPANFGIVKEGMRLTVTGGTAGSLNVPGMLVAAKTGSAQVGISKKKLNAWIEGFFPYKNPRYAFAIVMEGGAYNSPASPAQIMRSLIMWMQENKMPYVTASSENAVDSATTTPYINQDVSI
ncbi:MAG: penicillin-binding transpeptidase domain-containing protein [Candidatus Paceibacterota bacterium]|jgi:penicillin-binding protein 2